jgi:hypothetical protein
VVTQEEIKGENSQEVAAKNGGRLWTKALKLGFILAHCKTAL